MNVKTANAKKRRELAEIDLDEARLKLQHLQREAERVHESGSSPEACDNADTAVAMQTLEVKRYETLLGKE